MEYILEVKNLTKKYKKSFLLNKVEKTALNNISFKVKKGEIFGILGPNGAGKSTLLNILIDIVNYDSGKILFFGKDFNKNKRQIKRKMALIDGTSKFDRVISIFNNLKFYCGLYKKNISDAYLNDLLKEFGIFEIKDKKFSQLSTGQKTRVNFIKGILIDPDIILMDEPTIGLDPVISKKIRKTILDKKKNNKTIILTSHNMDEVDSLCDRILFILDGKVLKIGKNNYLKNLIKKNEIEIYFKNKKENLEELKVKIKNFFKNKKITNLKIKKKDKIFKINFFIENDFILNDLLNFFIKKNIEIKDIKVKKPTLEKIFIELSEGRL